MLALLSAARLAGCSLTHFVSRPADHVVMREVGE
jgi:hypothetical protein